MSQQITSCLRYPRRKTSVTLNEPPPHDRTSVGWFERLSSCVRGSIRTAAWSLRMRALASAASSPVVIVSGFGGGSSVISTGSTRRSCGLILSFSLTARKKWPIQDSQRNGGLIDGFSQKGGIPYRSVLSLFTGTAGCAMTFAEFYWLQNLVVYISVNWLLVWNLDTISRLVWYSISISS